MRSKVLHNYNKNLQIQIEDIWWVSSFDASFRKEKKPFYVNVWVKYQVIEGNLHPSNALIFKFEDKNKADFFEKELNKEINFFYENIKGE